MGAIQKYMLDLYVQNLSQKILILLYVIFAYMILIRKITHDLQYLFEVYFFYIPFKSTK